MDAEPVVRRQRPTAASTKSRNKAPGRGTTSRAKAPSKNKTASGSKQSNSRASRGSGSHSKEPSKNKAVPKTRAVRKKSAAGTDGLSGYLVRPSTAGPKVRLGILWFIAAVGSVIIGRWAVMVLWAAVAAVAAWQVSRAWANSPRAVNLPSWTPHLSAGAAVLLTAAATLGTSLAGIALILVPVSIVGVVMVSGRRPASAGAAAIGTVLASVPAMSVILVARTETWAAIFLVVAVSFYDAGYFIGAAESSSRLEGPVTGGIGLLAVTFAASAFEAQPFDRATAWLAGVMILLACPLGQMLTSIELPRPDTEVPAMRRLDAYLVAAPLMLGAVWAVS